MVYYLSKGICLARVFRWYLRSKPSRVWWNLWSADGNAYLTINLKDCPAQKWHTGVCCWAALWNQLCFVILKSLAEDWQTAETVLRRKAAAGFISLDAGMQRKASSRSLPATGCHAASLMGSVEDRLWHFNPWTISLVPHLYFMVCKILPQWQRDGVRCICLVLHDEDQTRPVRKTIFTRPENKLVQTEQSIVAALMLPVNESRLGSTKGKAVAGWAHELLTLPSDW